MGLVSVYTEAPYQGVSQAPPQVRSTTQAETLEDCFVSIPQGWQKRPPFEYVGKLEGHPGLSNGLLTLIQTAGPENDGLDYFLTIALEGAEATPRLYSFDPLAVLPYPSVINDVAVSVSAEAQDYLDTSLVASPHEFLRALTVEDYTFLTSRGAIVGKVATTVPARDPEGLLWVRQSAYGRKYVVTVTPSGGTPVTVTLKTPDGSAAAQSEFVDTDVIAQALVSGSYTALGGASISGNLAALSGQGFTVTRIGATIALIRNTGNFTMKVEDGQGGSAFLAIKDRVQRFSDLPLKAFDGFTIRIVQATGEDNDDFIVKFIENAGEGTGTWQETIAPGAELGLDPETMPVGLFNELGTWMLDVLPWGGRTTGDENIAPDPDFVGTRVQDVSFWRGRLVLVADEGVTLSASDDPFRFYPRTLSSVLADDPIGLVSPYPSKSVMRYALPFDERLIIFGDKHQAVIKADGITTLETAEIDVLTSYESSPLLRPQAVNGKAYFAANRGKTASIVYEQNVDRISATTNADDTTVAVPRYLPSGIDRVASCPVNYTTAYGKSGSTQIYVHLYRYAEQERVQNAWQRWNLPAGYTLGGMYFKNTELYVLACFAANGTSHLLKLDLSPDVLDADPDSRILTRLDLRLDDTQVELDYDSPSDTTLVTLPYLWDEDTRVVVRAPGGVGGRALMMGPLPSVPEGLQANVNELATELVASDQFVLDGDWTQCALYIGSKYEAKWVPSRFYVMGGDNRPLRSNRQQLRRLTLDLSNTGYIKVRVTAKGRAPREYVFEGIRLDDPNSVYDQAPSATIPFTVPLMSNTEQTLIEIINDTHFPSGVLGLEWRAEVNEKAQRV
jgi:hypothetical protein